MNVKLKMKAQVNIFKGYEVEWGHFAIALVNKEIPLKNLVEREFGPNLDGVGALHNLSFIEKEQLNKGLQKVKEHLARISHLVKQGERFEDIKKRLEQNSVQLTPIGVSPLKKSTPVVPKFIPLLKTKKEILDKYNIKDKQLLEEAVELIQKTDYRLIYKYNYGIMTPRLLKQKILDLLDIDEIEYEQALYAVQQELPHLIEEALKNRKALVEYNQIRSELKQPVKKKVVSNRVEESVKPVEKTDNSKAEVVEKIGVKEENSKVVVKSTKKGRKNAEKNFLNYFVSSNVGSEEREKIYQIICYFIENYVFKDDLGYIEAKENYGNDLLQELNEKDSSRTVAFYNFIAKTKKYVEIKKSHRRPVRFVAYFTSPNMSKEERKKVEEQVYEVVRQIPRKNSYYQIGVKGYGEGLKGDYVKGSIEKKEGVLFFFLIQTVNKCLERIHQKGNLDSCFPKERKYFMDEFFDVTMDDETKELIRKKVRYFIETYIPKGHIGYKQAKILFGEDLLQERRNAPIAFQSYYSFIDSIQTYLGDKKVKHRPLRFLDYFTTFAMNEETRNKIEILLEEYSENVSEHLRFYEVGEKLYGEKLKGVYTEIELSQTEKNQFAHLVKSIRKYIEQRQCGKEKDIINNFCKRRKNNFVDYIVSLSASLEEREEAYKKIDYFTANYVQEEDRGYKVAQEFYGNTLREPYCKKKILENENYYFHYFVTRVKQYIKTGKRKKHPLKFMGYFLTPMMEEEERRQVQEKVYTILKEFPKDTPSYQIGMSFYGEDFKQDYNSAICSNQNIKNLCKLVNAVQEKLEQERKEEKSISYLKNAIENLENVENKEEIITLVLTEFPMFFNQLLHSRYFSTLFSTLTEKEGELVYLKLLQRINVKLTDAEISKIMGLTLEEISTYQIMTKEDSFNQINQYIKRK